MSSIELVVFSSETNITYTRLSLRQNQTAPESIAFDCKGKGLYVGISDGRILKWHGYRIGWKTYVVTAPNRSDTCNVLFSSPLEQVCGRPLGLKFDMTTCELYITDASFGLMKVGRKGGVVKSLAKIAGGIPFKLLNGLDVDFFSKVVYFTDSSANYHRREFLIAVNNNDKSGRLMKYDMETEDVTVLLKNLSLANGVALSKNKNFVLVTQSIGVVQILKYWLTGYKAGTYEMLPQLDGAPDNINRNGKGDFWVALRGTKLVKINHFGEILETLDGGKVFNPSDVPEFCQRLWICFVDQSFIYDT